jgi:hypothetical protein
MALDTRIALGIQPIQQPQNMLGQYAQIMAIKAAQQETEGYEGLRGALSQGVPDDPTTLLQYGKQGRATYESLLKGKKEQLDSAEKRLTLTGQIAGYVRDNPTPENFASAVGTMVQNGVLTTAQAQRVIADAGNDPTKIKTYAERAAAEAVSEVDKMRDKTSRANNAASVGASYYSSNVSKENSLRTDARMREQQEFERNRRNVVAGEGQFLQTDAYGNVYPVTQFGATRGPNAPAPAMPPAAANALITTQPSVNALVPTAQPQGAGPTVAAAAAMDAQNNVPRPKVPIRQPVAVIKDGQVTLVTPDQAVGMTPATPGAEKILEKKQIAEEGKKSVDSVLGTLYSQYSDLVKTGGITDTRKSITDNISARTGASAAGQFVGSYAGTPEQSFRDTIAQTRPLLLTAIMKATGLSATQLNSNVELQTYLKTATDDKVSIQSNVNAMNNISQMFGLGKKFELPALSNADAPPKAENTVDIPPAGLDSEIARLWKYMTPEERKLWQK